MVEELENLFPRLKGTTYRITSPTDWAYNCIAWAAGFTNHWWWPIGDPQDTHWPSSVPRVYTLDAFRAVFVALGYVPCNSEAPEPGYQKVALFADWQRTPTHAARQLLDGRWTSKLGRMEDIEHELLALEGDVYGTVVLVMKRPIPATATAAVPAP
jgi:hypothetical protein